MLITFWSPAKGQSGTSSNALAVSIAKVLKENKKVLLANCSLEDSLEHALVGTTDPRVLDGIGIDALIRTAKMNSLDKETVRNTSFSFFGDQLHFLTGTRKTKKEFFNIEENNLPNVLSCINKYYDYTIVDIASDFNELTSDIIDKSDLIIVNLPQNKRIIDYYIKKYNTDNSKTIYLLGNYDYNSSYNLKNISKIFPTFKRKILSIPYNIEYSDAMSDSKVIEFMYKNNLQSETKDGNFINEVEKVCDLISDYRYE